jgi:hypothetical protein
MPAPQEVEQTSTCKLDARQPSTAWRKQVVTEEGARGFLARGKRGF